jgi:SAM-dependent methyltransferase
MERPLLDVGSGFAEFGQAFFDEAADVGLDISRRDLLLSQEADVYKSLLQADARRLPLRDAAFRSVMSVSVLEHIPDVAPFFPEAYRVLQPGGKLVFSVPLVEMDDYMLVPPLARTMGLRGVGQAYMRRIHRAFKHVNLHEPEWWLGKVREAGFDIERQRRIISRRATRMFDFGLPAAMVSQAGRLTSGRRWVWHPEPIVDMWTRILRPVVRAEEDEGDGSNLFVVAVKR